MDSIYKSSKRSITLSDVVEMEREGLGDRRIGERLGISKSGFRKIRDKMGWTRSCPAIRFDSGKQRKPLKSDEEKRENRNAYMRKYRKENPQCHHRTAYENGKYVGGRSRKVCSIILGRPLKPNEVVHHIDGIGYNDNPENLMVFATQKDHLAFHRGWMVEAVLDTDLF